MRHHQHRQERAEIAEGNVAIGLPRFTIDTARLEQDELLPSGRQSRFANRVAWAKVYLERAGLLASPQRGRFTISPRGREVLSAQPARIDVKFLAQYPEFLEFQKAKRQTEGPSSQLSTPEAVDAETPEEVLGAWLWTCC